VTSQNLALTDRLLSTLAVRVTVEMARPLPDPSEIVRVAELTFGVQADGQLPGELWSFMHEADAPEPELISAYLYGAMVLGIDAGGAVRASV
jgi:hypothetical protein